MSFKGEIEDKSVEQPLPRSIPALRSIINEVRQAITQNRHEALQGLLPELAQQRKRVYVEQIEASRVGAPMEHLVAYADVCNLSGDVYAHGIWLINGLGTPRR